MSDTIDIGYSLDPSAYLTGVSQIDAANAQLQASMSKTTASGYGLTKALSLITPSRTMVAGFGLFAQQAAGVQQQLSGLSATSTVTNVNVGQLSAGIRKMAQDMPMGFTASAGLVNQFSRMGIVGANSAKQVVALASATEKLGGATGDNVSALASGMTDLARATGNTNLDPKRFTAMGDSLTTISATSGSSATSVLAFAKNIAPLAQAAGIGTTGILGISGAFSKLGEDGVGASTAVNKMLTDMNRAIRDGSPDLKTYANFAGQSADAFQRLFKANPTQALTNVISSISSAGPAGGRMLEKLGLDGVRSQRALQALVASGGLQPSIAAAQSAYGSGSTEKAASAAFSGLNDELSQLSESSHQVAVAFGTPLLAPLSAFAHGLSTATGGLSKLLNSRPAQTAISALGMGALAVGGLKMAAGPLTTALLGKQLLTSGPVSSLLGGLYAGGMGREGGMVDRLSAGARGMVDEGTLRQGALGGVRQGAYDFGLGLTGGAGRDVPFGPQSAPRAPLISRLRGGIGAYGNNLAQSYMGVLTQQYNNSVLPFDQRKDAFTGVTGGFKGAASAADAALAGRSGNTAGGILGGLANATKAFHTEVTATAGSTGRFRETLKTASMAGTSFMQANASLMSSVGGSLRSVGSSLGRMAAGPVGASVAIGGLMALDSKLKSSAVGTKETNQAYMGSDINATINAYRESIGKATAPSVTAGSIGASLATSAAHGAATASFSDARKITDKDIAAANATRGKTVTTYQGSTKDVISQVMANNPGGYTPDELKAVQIDLLRQLPADQVKDVMAGLPSGADASTGGLGASDFAKIATTDAGAAGSAKQKMPGFFKDVLHGMGVNVTNTTGKTQTQIGGLEQGINQQFQTQSGKYQSSYASQEMAKNVNAAMKALYDSGNKDAFAQFSSDMGTQLGGSDLAGHKWSMKDFKKSGFDFTTMVAGQSGAYKSTRADLLGAGGRTTGAGGINPITQQPIETAEIAGVSPLLGSIFNPTTKGSTAASAMNAAITLPDNIGKQTDAINSTVAAASAAGISMNELAVQAAKAASSVGTASDRYAKLVGIQQAAMTVAAHSDVALPSAQKQVNQYKQLAAMVAIKPQTQDEADQQTAMKQQMAGMEQSVHDSLVARLNEQRQYDTQVGRMTQDAGLSRTRAEQDYQTQVARSTAQFQVSQERAQQQYGLSIARAEQDFDTTRLRTIRDFNINAMRAEQDYQKSRSRSVRDFNISLSREIQDAAASMYDPYSRIQAKPTWDAANLMVNLKEQTAAMVKQQQQLAALRKAGLSAGAIDQLGLGKAENAQQVSNLTADMTPAMIAELNKTTAARAAASGGLFTDTSNKDLARQKADFAKSLKDQATDFSTSVNRSRSDLHKGLADQEADYKKSMARAAADFTLTMTNAQTDFSLSLSYMAADEQKGLDRSSQDLQTALKRMATDIKTADTEISGTMQELQVQTARALNGQGVQWGKVVTNNMKTWVGDIGTQIVPAMNKVWGQMGLTPAEIKAANADLGPGSQQKLNGLAEGGKVRGSSPHPKADNIPVLATAGEFMHPVDAVQYYGEGVMEDIRTKRIPREQIQRRAEGGMIYKQMESWIHRNLPGVGITSDYRTPAQNRAAGGSPTSYHLQGKAVDMVPSMATFDKIAATFSSKIAELWYSPANGRQIKNGHPFMPGEPVRSQHFNHVHWAMNNWSQMLAALGGGTAGGVDLDKMFAGMKSSSPIYNALTGKTKSALATLLDTLAANGQGGGVAGNYTGDTSAGGTNAAANQAIAKSMLPRYGWGNAQFLPLVELWNGESGWNQFAENKGSGAYGIPQALPGSKMASVSGDWRTNPSTQIKWGLQYIKDVYGSPANTWAKWNQRSPHWYDTGGWMAPGEGKYVNGTGKPEAVLTDGQWTSLSAMAAQVGRLVTKTDAQGISAAAGSHIVVNNNQRIVYDNRNDFAGADFTVVSSDPDEMARKLEAKQVLSRVSQTRGVRGR